MYPPVAELLPHAPPAILVDRLLHVEARSVRAAFTVRADCPYFEPGQGLPTWLSVEIMAQTCALHSGWEAYQQQTSIKDGMLLGVRQLDVHAGYFAEKDQLIVVAHKQQDMHGHMVVCTATISREATLLASATLLLWEKHE